jgi:hypothetical protein
MNRRASLLFSLILALPLAAAANPSITDTRLLADPAGSAERIAFI